MPNLEILQKNLAYLAESSVLAESLLEKQLSQFEISLSEILQLTHKTAIPLQHLLEVDIAQKHAAQAQNIKMLVMDCDGVLTDGGMYFTENGDEIKRFNAKDGQGIKKLHQAGIQTGIISAGVNPKAIAHRAQMLGIEKVYVGKEPKINILKAWLQELNLSLSEIAYIGDDISDIEILESVGFSACPSNAVDEVLNTAKLILKSKGGDACIRELVENYLLK